MLLFIIFYLIYGIILGFICCISPLHYEDDSIWTNLNIILLYMLIWIIIVPVDAYYSNA